MKRPSRLSLIRLAAAGLHGAGLTAPLTWAAGRARRAPAFQILTYHRVNDDTDPFFSALPTGDRSLPDNLFIDEKDADRTPEGGQMAASPGQYTDENVSNNANAYLRPYSGVSGQSNAVSLNVWVD